MEKLKQRIATSNSNKSQSSGHSNFKPVSSVVIASGAHKYVLISAQPVQGTKDCEETCYFVTSRCGAHYHRNAAEPMVDRLQESGYTNIRVLGGGRIYLNDDEKKIKIFGYSYGFGRADHVISKKVITSDERYIDYDVTWSNDGY